MDGSFTFYTTLSFFFYTTLCFLAASLKTVAVYLSVPGVERHGYICVPFAREIFFYFEIVNNYLMLL